MQITQGILVLLCTNFPNPLVPVFSSGQQIPISRYWCVHPLNLHSVLGFLDLVLSMDVLGGHVISYWIWNTFCVWIVYVFLFFAKVQATSIWKYSHNTTMVCFCNI
jgi:hypothetical protein